MTKFGIVDLTEEGLIAEWREQIASLKTACQLHVGAYIVSGKHRYDYKTAVFITRKLPEPHVEILGVEVFEGVGEFREQFFLPWHAVDLVIPSDVKDGSV